MAGFLVLMLCWAAAYLVGKDHKEAAELRPASDDFPVNLDLIGFPMDGLRNHIGNLPQASPCQGTTSLALGTLRTATSRESSVFPLLLLL